MTDTRRKLLLAGIIVGMLFSSLDQTIVGTAMPRIIGDLGGLSIMTWVTTAYLLTSTSVMPIVGKLADVFGRRVIYVSGILIFMLGSALSGTSETMTQLIIFRGIQGIGAGMMMPMSMTIVGDLFPPEKRGKWQGVMGAIYGLSSILGPQIGGWLVDAADWRWVFYINLPIGALAALLIFFGLQGEKRLSQSTYIDYPGAITIILGVVALLLGLSLGGKDFPWNSWQIISLFLAAAFFLGLFIWIEKHSPDPILDLGLFKNRTFTVINLVGFIMGLGMFGAILFIPLFMQGVIGVSATRSGSMMIPMMTAMIFTSILAGRLIVRVTYRFLVGLGMAIMTLGFFGLSTMTAYTTESTAVIFLIIAGLGMGLVMPTLTISVQNAFPKEKRGVVTSTLQFFRSIGGTLGVTILGVVMNHSSAQKLQENFFPLLESMPESVKESSQVSQITQELSTNPQGAFNALLSPETLARIPAEIKDVLLPPLREALAYSLHSVFLVAGIIVASGVILAWFLGKARVQKTEEGLGRPSF